MSTMHTGSTGPGQAALLDEAATGQMRWESAFGRLDMSGRLAFLAKYRTLDLVIYALGFLSTAWFYLVPGVRFALLDLIIRPAYAAPFLGFPDERYFAISLIFVCFLLCIILMLVVRDGHRAQQLQALATTLAGGLITIGAGRV